MLPHDVPNMKSLFSKRFFHAVLGLMMLVFLSFFISRSISGDPLRKMALGGDQLYATESTTRVKNYERLYRQMGFDLPAFYVTISGMAVPDSFKRLPDQRFKELLIKTAYWSGNPEAAYEWCSWYCIHFDRKFDFINPDEFSTRLDYVFSTSELNEVNKNFYKSKWIFLVEQSHSNQWKKWIPVIGWTMENQFHHWLFGNNTGQKGLLWGNLGTSWLRGMDVKDALLFPFLLSFILVFFVMLFSFPIALLLGAMMMKFNERVLTKFLNSFFLFLYAVPTFWIGTLLLFFFANPNYINIFPSAGPELVTHAGVFVWMRSLIDHWQYFIVPAVVLAYSTIVYLTQMTYELLHEELQKPYVTTLRAKGASENSILGIYVMKNVLVPVLVGLMSVFPVLVGGSVIIDFLFSLPGIGGVMAQACDQRDFPVVGGVLLLTGFVTIFSFFVTDIITAKLDPRISDHG